MRSLFTSFAAIAVLGIGLSGCELQIEKTVLRQQMDSVQELIRNGAFAKAAKIERPDIANGHEFSIYGTVPLPRKVGLLDIKPGSVFFRIGHTAYNTSVGFKFMGPMGNWLDVVILRDGQCSDALSIQASCKDIDAKDWTAVYDSAIAFAKTHGGAGQL